MHPILMLINLILDVFRWALIIWIIISWLIQFGIVNRHQPLVYRINDALSRLFEPILAKIRKHVPPLGSLDVAPIVLLIALAFVQYTINYYFLR
ncbi:MAG: YggT family protein [Alphaproteobacteria bacterium]|nr:YggT family protein [Alphaproteobacteria bacterium]